MSCYTAISSGITKDCNNIKAAIGVDKDLILVNYDDFDRDGTLDAANREADDTNSNVGGLTAIKLKLGAVQYTFEGTDYSVIPSVSPEVKEDGNLWYGHSVQFTVYNKAASARKTIENLGNSKVIAIAIDRSTGLYELFGAEQGLRINAVERTYTGAQNSNFYQVTLATPDIAVLKESSLGELAVSVVTATV